MGAAERRERERASLQKKILDAGREILVREGYESLTMRKLAEKIEYTPGALYAHFADKDALVRAICQADMLDFAARCQEVTKVADPMERLRTLATLYAKFALEHPEQYKVLFVLEPVQAFKDGLVVERGNPESDAYAILELAIAHAVEQGLFPAWKNRPQLVAQLMWAAMHGVVSIENRRTAAMDIPFEPIEDRVAAVCDVMLAGLGATKPPKRRKSKA
ncbi:MAG: TetR/AcrR family transcriptional regulator [Polyangiaceae bacterium]|nr:TetR/AcrR family transcriptional regulator [Polyangiaceae bacterium]